MDGSAEKLIGLGTGEEEEKKLEQMWRITFIDLFSCHPPFPLLTLPLMYIGRSLSAELLL